MQSGRFRPILPALLLAAAGLIGIIAAAGGIALVSLAPLLDPPSVLLTCGLPALGLAGAALGAGGIARSAGLGLGLLLSVNLLFGFSRVSQSYDTAPLAPGQPDGPAVGPG